MPGCARVRRGARTRDGAGRARQRRREVAPARPLGHVAEVLERHVRDAFAAAPLEQVAARQHAVRGARAAAVREAVAHQHGVEAPAAVAAHVLRLAVAARIARGSANGNSALDAVRRRTRPRSRPTAGPGKPARAQVVAHVEVEALAHHHHRVAAPERLAHERREVRVEPEGARELERLLLADLAAARTRAR